jgi:hypothetical protein
MTEFKVGDRVRIWDTSWQREADSFGVVSHVYEGGWEIDVFCDTRPGEVFAVYASNLDLIEEGE